MLTGLPEFDLGRRPERPARADDRRRRFPRPDAGADGTFQPSLDVTQRLGANVLASLTVNTDFAETEVDTRRTNLTRFPLFFPEKRTFFLEGADIFAFGLGLGHRRAALLQPAHRPGRRAARCRSSPAGRSTAASANTNFGGLVVGTNDDAGVAPRRRRWPWGA